MSTLLFYISVAAAASFSPTNLFCFAALNSISCNTISRMFSTLQSSISALLQNDMWTQTWKRSEQYSRFRASLKVRVVGYWPVAEVSSSLFTCSSSSSNWAGCSSPTVVKNLRYWAMAVPSETGVAPPQVNDKAENRGNTDHVFVGLYGDDTDI